MGLYEGGGAVVLGRSGGVGSSADLGLMKRFSE